MRVRALRASEELIAAWSRDLDELTDIQEAAVRAGVLDADHNLLVVAPTSSGKTLISEMAAARVAMGGQRHALFVVPMKSLAEEHYLRFRERYGELMVVVISTGDRLELDEDIRSGRFDLAVLTYEKLAALLVQGPELLGRCGCVVVDEGQMISDPSRGQALEVLITQVLTHPAQPRIVVLSASLDDLNQMDRWLRAEALVTAERPVPLDEAVCSAATGNALVRSPTGQVGRVQMTSPAGGREELAASLAVHHAEDGQQVIVFRTTVPGTMRLADRIAAARPATGIDSDLHDRLVGLEDPETVRRFRGLLACGVAYHNADLSTEERRLIEDAFRAGAVRILVSTTTLAMGVNMPADVVIVADHLRFFPGAGGAWGNQPIPVSEFRNAAGRAGRLGLGTEGTAILLADDDLRRRQLFNQYVLGPVEPAESQIPKQPLGDVVFRLLAGRIARGERDLVKFLTATLAYLNFYESHGGVDAIRTAVRGAIATAIGSALVVERDGQLLPTPVAQTLAAAGVSLATAIRFKSVVDRLTAHDLQEVDLVYEVARCKESGDRQYLQRRPPGGFIDPRENWTFSPKSYDTDGPFAKVLGSPVLADEEMQAVFRTACRVNWMEGEDARLLDRQFKMSRERLRTMGGYAAWLLDTLASAARAAKVDPARIRLLRQMVLKAQYGLPPELAPLARLRPPGISREALMQLRAEGVIDPDDLLEADPRSFQPALSPLQVERLKQAILEDTEATLRRKRTGHLHRAADAGIPPKLIETLYSATSGALEDAVCDALKTAGLRSSRIHSQPHGQEDIQVSTEQGTVVVAVTGSQSDQKPVKWNKAKEVLGQGVGLNPVNCVCVARPRFESLAERSARDIAREEGDRKLLLLPIDVFVEAVLRCSNGGMTPEELGDVMALKRGLLTIDDLPSTSSAVIDHPHSPPGTS